MFKVIIVGGEDTNDYKFFAKKCIFYLKNKAKEGITILSTGDSYVNAFAKACNIDIKTYDAEWGIYGNNALKMRTRKMIEECDAVIIFDSRNKSNAVFKNLADEYRKLLRCVEVV